MNTDSNHLVICRICGQRQHLPGLPPRTVANCARCESRLHRHTPRGVQRTFALSLSALILFVPAMALPILAIERLGHRNESTVWGGVVDLWQAGSPGISAIVFLCSIVIPLSKISGLMLLCSNWKSKRPQQQATLLQIIEVIGRWSMLDVFLVSILVATVKLGDIATVMPGPGIVAFAAVVLLTIFASASFDPRLFWHTETRTP
ncbi:paraquat-inducible protein A [PVC group bacterium]|nr:paraquat-inducible protein A [PVC group bacterium]